MSVASGILSFVDSCFTEQADEGSEEKFTVGLGFYDYQLEQWYRNEGLKQQT